MNCPHGTNRGLHCAACLNEALTTWFAELEARVERGRTPDESPAQAQQVEWESWVYRQVLCAFDRISAGEKTNG